MLFLTNRRLVEGQRSSVGRSVSFDLVDNEPSPSVFFCRRIAEGSYEELTAPVFFRRVRRLPQRQVVLFIHGYNCLPEPTAFPAALRLQALLDELAPELAIVIPFVWPCDDDFGLLLDYWDDQDAAEASAFAASRALGKFLAWRDTTDTEDACLKHLNILAHSMGNRVLRYAVQKWVHDHGAIEGIVRSLFMVAADVANDCLEPGQAGAPLVQFARNLVVYHAADDLALRTSKVVNLRHKIVSRRLGHTGPRSPVGLPAHIVSIDCNEVNGACDPLGHSYFLAGPDGGPGLVLRHIAETLASGTPAAKLVANDNAPSPSSSLVGMALRDASASLG